MYDSWKINDSFLLHGVPSPQAVYPKAATTFRGNSQRNINVIHFYILKAVERGLNLARALWKYRDVAA